VGEFSPGELSRLSHRSFGTPGAERLVVLVGTGAGVANDPLPRETLAHDIRVLAVTLEGAAVARSGVYGSETPVEQTATLLASLIREMLEPAAPGNGPSTAGLVAYGDASEVALHAVALLGDTIDRIALVAAAPPEQRLDRSDLGAVIAGVTAETRVFDGWGDDGVAAAWYESHLSGAKIEATDGEDPMTLRAVWRRVLSHVAPGMER
jgi:hypothetical protein